MRAVKNGGSDPGASQRGIEPHLHVVFFFFLADLSDAVFSHTQSIQSCTCSKFACRWWQQASFLHVQVNSSGPKGCSLMDLIALSSPKQLQT